MSREGNFLDDVAIENFFWLLKKKLLYCRDFTPLSTSGRNSLGIWIYCNNHKTKADLKGFPPAIHREHALLVV